MDIKRLIDCHQYPDQYKKYYHGDIVQDTVDALKIAEEAEEDDSKYEIFSLLPNDDELDEIYIILENAMSMSKPQMIDQIKQALEMIEAKNNEFESTKEYCQADHL